MTRILDPNPGQTRTIGPTTAAKLASRMIAAQSAVFNALPSGFASPTPLMVLLELLVAEDGGEWATLHQIESGVDDTPSVTRRWIEALKAAGLIEQRAALLGLTAHGYDTVVAMLEGIYAAQRKLD